MPAVTPPDHARRQRDVAALLAHLRSQRAVATDRAKAPTARATARIEAVRARLLLETFGLLPAADNTDAGEA